MQKPFFLVKNYQQKDQYEVELNSQKIMKKEPHQPSEIMKRNEFNPHVKAQLGKKTGRKWQFISDYPTKFNFCINLPKSQRGHHNLRTIILSIDILDQSKVTKLLEKRLKGKTQHNHKDDIQKGNSNRDKWQILHIFFKQNGHEDDQITSYKQDRKVYLQLEYGVKQKALKKKVLQNDDVHV